jgi:hypothetical protein
MAPVANPQVATLSNTDYFYNLWELEFLGLAREKVAAGDNNVEVVLMGFQDFTGNVGSNGKRLPASFEEASQRPVYTTVAMLNVGP